MMNRIHYAFQTVREKLPVDLPVSHIGVPAFNLVGIPSGIYHKVVNIPSPQMSKDALDILLRGVPPRGTEFIKNHREACRHRKFLHRRCLHCGQPCAYSIHRADTDRKAGKRGSE